MDNEFARNLRASYLQRIAFRRDELAVLLVCTVSIVVNLFVHHAATVLPNSVSSLTALFPIASLAVAIPLLRKGVFTLTVLLTLRVGNHWDDSEVAFFVIWQPIDFEMINVTRYCTMATMVSFFAMATALYAGMYRRKLITFLARVSLIVMLLCVIAGQSYGIWPQFWIAAFGIGFSAFSIACIDLR